MTVYRANHAFMAIPVKAGEHEITFRYFPRVFYYATSVGGSMLSLVILVMALHPRKWILPAEGNEIHRGDAEDAERDLNQKGRTGKATP